MAGMLDQIQLAIPDGRPLWTQLALPAQQTPEKALCHQAEIGFATAIPKRLEPTRHGYKAN
jgi:hypothetical protein